MTTTRHRYGTYKLRSEQLEDGMVCLLEGKWRRIGGVSPGVRPYMTVHVRLDYITVLWGQQIEVRRTPPESVLHWVPKGKGPRRKAQNEHSDHHRDRVGDLRSHR